MGPCIISIFQYISYKMQCHSLFISGNCSTCFGWYFYPSSRAHTTVSTASGICHTVTAICRYRGRVGTGLNVLWVAYVEGIGPHGGPRASMWAFTLHYLPGNRTHPTPSPSFLSAQTIFEPNLLPYGYPNNSRI
jgi:hypothetical protein